MNRDQFHNSLAIHLGRKIVLDKRLQIEVAWQEIDHPFIEVRLTDIPIVIRFNASEANEEGWQQLSVEQKQAVAEVGLTGTITEIVKAAHLAYKESFSSRF